FHANVVDTLSPERRQRFMYAADGAYRVKSALREKMAFAPQDLLADPPFSGLDLVTCRNLLIYLEPDAGDRVLWLLHSALRVGGHLFVGKAESRSLRHTGFENVSAHSGIYRKVSNAAPSVAFPTRPACLRSSRSSRSAVEAHIHHEVVCTYD